MISSLLGSFLLDALAFSIRSPRRLYAGGAARGDCHHWRTGGVALARGAGGARGGTALGLPEQFASDWLGDAELSRQSQCVSAAQDCWRRRLGVVLGADPAVYGAGQSL